MNGMENIDVNFPLFIIGSHFSRFKSNITRRTDKTEFVIIECLSAANYTMAFDADNTSVVVISILECGILGCYGLRTFETSWCEVLVVTR